MPTGLALLVAIAMAMPRDVSAQAIVAPVPLSGRDASSGAVSASQAVGPGLLSSVLAVTPVVLVRGPYAGSVPAGAVPFSGVLSLQDAIARGLEHNLAAVGLTHAGRQARARATLARSALLPTIDAWVSDSEQKINLAALGVQFETPPGFVVPETVGPYNVFDLRARVAHTLIDRTATHNFRAAREAVQASDFAARDTRDAIVLAVGATWHQALAARARRDAAVAQVTAARALFDRTSQQQTAGLATPLDVNRAQLQLLSQEHRLAALTADVAKHKITLARLVGLPPSDRYELEPGTAFTPEPLPSVDDAVRAALVQRADIKAAEAQVRVADQALSAARAVRLPTVALGADYGGSRASGSSMQSTYRLGAAVRIPIWEGGRASGEIAQAEAVLSQRRAELQDLMSEVEAEVRRAHLDLQAAASQIDVARRSVELNAETLLLARQRFDAGLDDNVSIVQAQQQQAAAEQDVITSVFAYNVSRLGLARATGQVTGGEPSAPPQP
jgi:outer membrane protein TolC